MRSSNLAVQLQDASVVFGRSLYALDQVNLDIPARQTVGIVGESGSGKSTLLRLLVGLTLPTEGTVKIFDQPIIEATRRDPKTIRRQVQMLMQDAVATLSPRMTVGNLLIEAVAIHKLNLEATQTRILELLSALRLPRSILDRYPHEISGGQARRIGVIRALLLNPSLLAADEPTAGLDVSVQGELLNLIMDFQREMGLTLVMVSHNLHVIKRVTQRSIVMYLGQIIEDAGTSDLFARPAHPYSTTLLSTNPMLSKGEKQKSIVLEGEIPSNVTRPTGCRFHTRCPVAQTLCSQKMPSLETIENDHKVRCHYPYSLSLPRINAPTG